MSRKDPKKREQKLSQRKRKLSRGTAPSHPCDPGPGWNVYDGKRLTFSIGRRWVDRIYISPHLSRQQADEALGLLTVLHLHEVDEGRATHHGSNMVSTSHRLDRQFFVVVDHDTSCAYFATPRDLERDLGVRVLRVIKGGQ